MHLNRDGAYRHDIEVEFVREIHNLRILENGFIHQKRLFNSVSLAILNALCKGLIIWPRAFVSLFKLFKSQITPTSITIDGIYRRMVFAIVLLSVIAVEPVAAQSAVCDADKLPSMIEGFFQLTTGLGVIGLVIVWQADSLVDMFTLNPDQRKGFKQHRRSALKSAMILVSLGPLYTVAGSIMGLPLAQCVDLVPW